MQRQKQDFPKGGGMGRRGYGYFILGHFVGGHVMRCTDIKLVDKIMLDKKPVKNAWEDKILAILRDRDDKMLILSKHFIYHTDG